MLHPRVPRFSPSFSRHEALAVVGAWRSRPDAVERVAAFERAFAERVRAPHAVMVPSARWGFAQVLVGWGLGPGDEVIFPGLTYWAMPSAGMGVGVTPVFADVGLTSHVLDPDAFRQRLSPRTRAVVPTHLYGTPADVEAVRELAREAGLRVIEDTSQAFGARLRGAPVGGWGDASVYTFGLTKNITTLSGAMVTTSDAELAAHLRVAVAACEPMPDDRMLREAVTGVAMAAATHPWVYPFTVEPVIRVGNRFGQDPIHDRFGERHVRYTEPPRGGRRPGALQAAVGLTQLDRLEALNGARARNGRWLDEALRHVPGLVLPTYPRGAEPIYMSYVVHHPRRDELMVRLREDGVDTTLGYMSACPDDPTFAELGQAGSCPNATTSVAQMLHVPVHPNLTQRSLKHMAEAVRRACMALR